MDTAPQAPQAITCIESDGLMGSTTGCLSDPETPERPGLAALLRRAVQSAAAVAGISSSSETGAERTAGVCEWCRGRVVGLAYCPQCRGSGSAPLAPR